METIEYKTHDRTRWVEGEWDNEPDKIQWQDPITKFPCLIVRNGAGAWCGYVGVPQGHPAYEIDYDVIDVEVHGDLTYSDKCQERPKEKSVCHIPGAGETDDVWWLGFDCMHAWDDYPTMPPEYGGAYRNQEYVIQQVISLATQLNSKCAIPPS